MGFICGVQLLSSADPRVCQIATLWYPTELLQLFSQPQVWIKCVIVLIECGYFTDWTHLHRTTHVRSLGSSQKALVVICITLAEEKRSVEDDVQKALLHIDVASFRCLPCQWSERCMSHWMGTS